MPDTATRGRCSKCRRWYQVRTDGTVRVHSAYNPDFVHQHCSGGGKPPEEQRP